ncbi:ferredoxin-nitrite reductase [Paracoccus haematequi]|uniref:Ferredoxin-nitrite reductase n=2 Tax=Paracoccus haematequi TaxID=2491866 RepID=A0A3S4CY58_9RHOB|nr:ferredoxin-nitrite reductase [Paracoccus haematequi]
MSGRVKGWCPGALTPMPSGDGLVLRVRPRSGRLTPAQMLGLADLAERFGDGAVTLTSRANLQLRAVAPADLEAVQADLRRLDLIDTDPAQETRRNILVSPIWTQGDPTMALAAELAARLAELPPLPAKFGFAIDTGPAAILTGASADLRIERSSSGLILRAEGMARGEAVPDARAVTRLIALAHWFAAQPGARRMGLLVGGGARPPLAADAAPLTTPPLRPGPAAPGTCVAAPFGRMATDALRAIAVAPARPTPWRSLVIEAASPPRHPQAITDPDDPRLRVAVCVGKPRCSSASVETMRLARDLAPLVPPGAVLHVAGCAKGCAHPRPADLVLTGRDGHFDLLRGGRPGDPPQRRSLDPADIAALLKDPHAPSL